MTNFKIGSDTPGLKHLEWLINNSKIFKNAKRNYIACINWMIVILQTFVGQICLSISWCTQSCLRAIPLATQLWRNEILNITARRQIVKLSSDLLAKKNNVNFFIQVQAAPLSSYFLHTSFCKSKIVKSLLLYHVAMELTIS